MGEDNGRESTNRLAELQERMHRIEQRATQMRKELLQKEGEQIDRRTIASVLSLFVPVWDALLSKEYVRIIQLLVERVVYDGKTGKVSVSFRASGIYTLAFETERAQR